MGEDCVSPASHSAFSTPREMMNLWPRLRRLSGGKPTGFKLCVGHPYEFLGVVKAMLQTGYVLTSSWSTARRVARGLRRWNSSPNRHAAPRWHHLCPFRADGLWLRDKIKLAASGKIISAFDMARVFALGADWCNAARGFMFALGCIQAQNCHTGDCPTGVATQDPSRQRALVVSDKSARVASFHKETLKALGELIAAAGLDHPRELRPHHFVRRLGQGTVTFAELYRTLDPGELLAGSDDPRFRESWAVASADGFAPMREPEPAIVPLAAE